VADGPQRRRPLGLVLTAVVVVWLLRVALTSGEVLDSPTLATALQVAPSAYLGFGFLAVIAPLTAGGGNELVPHDQLAAFPVRTSTWFLGGLLLAPLNLVWLVQLLALAAFTAFLTLDSSLVRGTVDDGGVRRLHHGPRTGAGLAGGRPAADPDRTAHRDERCAAARGVGRSRVHTGRGSDLLAASPTHSVVQAVTAGDTARWATTTAVLLGLTALGLLVGSRACGWALRRPGDAGSAGRLDPVRRRRSRQSVLGELIAVDRASVWRARRCAEARSSSRCCPGCWRRPAACPGSR
jgi:hypothetical protein